MSLLKSYVECREEDSRRIQAVLTVFSGESNFQMFETNGFNKLPIISLSFQPSTDEEAKQFLTTQLAEMKATCNRLEEELEITKKQNETVCSELHPRKETSEDTYQQGPVTNENCAGGRGQEQSRSTTLDRIDGEGSAVEKQLRDDLEIVRAGNEIMTKENGELRLCMQEREKKISDLAGRVADLEGQKMELEVDCSKLKEQNCCLQHKMQKLESRMDEGKVSNKGLEEQVVQSRLQIEAIESSKEYLESRVEELQKAVAKAEEHAKKIEIEKKKSDQIIEKFATELQSSKEKTKKKQALLLRREEQVNQLLERIDGLKAEKELLQRDYEKMSTDALELETTNKELMARFSRFPGRAGDRSRPGVRTSGQGDGVRSSSQPVFPPPTNPSHGLWLSGSDQQPHQWPQQWYPQGPLPSQDSGHRDFASRYNRLRR